MSINGMAEAVRITNGRAKLGLATSRSVRPRIAETGDYISSGALTHSAVVFDLSLGGSK
jgi:nicotinate-nucleotide pyrophosphorylase